MAVVMDVTRWGLALFIISGVLFLEVWTFSSRPLFCHRLMPRSPYHETECSYPCVLSHGDPSTTYGTLFLAEKDWTPCSVGHCRSGACVPAHLETKRQKRSILLTMGGLEVLKKLLQRMKNRNEKKIQNE
ncbi:uncharacterized protein LOC142786721 [Rhipicephalus microplus]|uniref:uncharacterized protein LOC142786721 n=1 Tax=Rhipicephalus microplus TaxID=6941 RepID=UPI003F6D5043